MKLKKKPHFISLLTILMITALTTLPLRAKAQSTYSTTLWNGFFSGGGKIMVYAGTERYSDSMWLGFGFIDMYYRKTLVGDSLIMKLTNKQELLLTADSNSLPIKSGSIMGVKSWLRWYYFKMHRSEIEELIKNLPKKFVFHSQPHSIISELSLEKKIDEFDSKMYLKNSKESSIVSFKKITRKSKKELKKFLAKLLE